MADNIVGRTVIQIVGDTSQYNNSIDGAVQRTAALQAKEKALSKELQQTKQQLEMAAKVMANNPAARERNTAAIQRAIAQYGQESTQVQRLQQVKASLERTQAQLNQRIEIFRTREQNLSSQLSAVNQLLNQQANNTNRVASSSNTAAGALNTMSQRLSNMMRMMKSLLAMRATRSFLEATIGSLSQFEQYETSFAVMLGDMDKAKSLMEDLKDFAARTPFEVPDVTQNAQLLMNYGVELEDIITTLTQLGDLSQGSVDKLNRISLAYGQMLTKGKVTGEELRQMTEAGVPLTQALADNMGKSTAELSKLIEKGSVGIPELDAAIASLTTGTGKFAGMMEKQSQTLLGRWSTLKDNMGQFARDMGEEAFEETKSSLEDISSEFETMKENGDLSELSKQWGAVFGMLTKLVLGSVEGLVKHKNAVGALVTVYGAWKVVQQITAATTAYKAFMTATEGATAAQAALNAVTKTNPLVALAGALTAVVGGIVALSQAINQNVEEMESQREELEKLRGNVIEYLSDYSSTYSDLVYISNELLPRIREINAELKAEGDAAEYVEGKKALLKNMVDQVNESLGEEALSINSVTGELKDNTDAIDENIEVMKKRALAEAANTSLKNLYQEQADNQLELIGNEQELIKLKEERAKIEAEVNEKLANNSDWATDAQIKAPLDDITKQINDLNSEIEEGKKLDREYANSIQKMSEAYDQLSNAAEDVQTSIGDVTDSLMSTDELFANLENSEKRLKSLAAAQKEAADGGKLSISTIQSLGENYSQLMPYIEDYMAGLIDEKELIAQFPALYQQESAQYAASIMEKYKDNEEFFANLRDNNAELFAELENNYRGDRGNWHTLAQAKGDIETDLITQLSAEWQKYYQQVGGNATKTVKAMQQQLSELNKEAQGPKQRTNGHGSFWEDWDIAKDKAELQNMINLLEPLTDLEGATFELNLADFDAATKKTEKAKKDSAEKEKTWQEKLYDELKYKREMEIIGEQEYLDGLIKIRDSYYGKDEENYRKYSQEVYKLQKQMEKDKEEALKNAFDSQLDLAKDYYDKQKELVEEQAEAEIDAINKEYDARLERAKKDYEAEKERVDGIIDELQREIDAKKRAREEEKLNDDLSFAQDRIQTLQTQIQYARSPEEKAELEKELKRQQEELKDLTVEKEVNELEAEKQRHEERLSNLEEEYEAEEKHLEEKRKKALAAAEEARDQTLKILDDSFNALQAGLYQAYGFINQETLSIGQRFANVTNEALKTGFDTIKAQAQATIDEMVAKVQDAVARLSSAIERTKRAYREGVSIAYSNSDNRSMTITNHITRGLTEGQVTRLMDRQAERLLYGRR